MSGSSRFKITPLIWVRISRTLTESNSQSRQPNIKQKKSYMELNQHRFVIFVRLLLEELMVLSFLFPRLKEAFSFLTTCELQRGEGCFRKQIWDIWFPPYLFSPGLWNHRSVLLLYSSVFICMGSEWVCSPNMKLDTLAMLLRLWVECHSLIQQTVLRNHSRWVYGAKNALLLP